MKKFISVLILTIALVCGTRSVSWGDEAEIDGGTWESLGDFGTWE